MSSDDQLAHWNKLHQQRTLEKYSNKPTFFAEEVIKLFPSQATILELGSGLGNDSAFFAENGFSVTSTDFSDTAIKANIKKYPLDSLKFLVKDIRDLSDLKNESFDVVYARLSLHYFSDSETRKIFQEISRVLKPEGLFCFMCKSIKDPLFGKGNEIEKDMFNFNNHIRHFFSLEYIQSLIRNLFTIKTIEEDNESLYGKEAAFIKVIAKKN